MFIWKTETILAEIEQQMPALKSVLNTISNSLSIPELDNLIEDIWLSLNSETIDYGIMENAEKVAVLPASGLGWSDVGSWDSLYDVTLPTDRQGNITIKGQMIAEDTRSTIVYGKNDKRLVATIGIEDVIIVDSDDVLLVAKRDQAQDVRQIVEKLKAENRDTFL